ncbi:MAG TPA: ankyrin repeat domain-containing protein [Bacteroidales bacterium]|nr:ankyrin repeat domain-containing protein [Bacteroidales bacterium]
MLKNRCIFFLFALIIFAGRSFGQVVAVDTSEYIPLFYSFALDYNLMVAAGKGYSGEVQRLINKGADINSESNQGVTPLIFAVANNKSETVSTLLANDPDIDKYDDFQENALLVAVKNNFQEIAEKLIRAGANINAADRYNATPLHYASLYGYAQMADMLLYYEAEINPKTYDGSTPLMAGIWAGNILIAELLINNGARIEEKDDQGFTPFLLSSYFGDTLMMKMLYDAGADILAETNKGQNALSLAIISKKNEAISFLLSLDKNWGSFRKSINDPYSVAVKYDNKEAVELLRSFSVPGRVKHSIDQVRFSVSSKLSLKDYYTGFMLNFTEPLSNMGITMGLDTKLWYTRILAKGSENVFYQYYNKGSIAYTGISKDFYIHYSPSRLKTSLSGSVLAGYSFGNTLKGTEMKPGNKFRLIPAVSLKWSYMNLAVDAGLEYVRSDFFKAGPVWLRIGIGYNYYFDNIRTEIKYPKWY